MAIEDMMASDDVMAGYANTLQQRNERDLMAWGKPDGVVDEKVEEADEEIELTDRYVFKVANRDAGIATTIAETQEPEIDFAAFIKDLDAREAQLAGHTSVQEVQKAQPEVDKPLLQEGWDLLPTWGRQAVWPFIAPFVKGAKEENPIVRGITEGVLHDAPQGIIDLSRDVVNALGGEFKEEDWLKIPQILESNPDSITEGVVRGLSQFMSIFGAAGGISKGATLFKQMMAGGLADATFDPTGGNLATLLRELDVDNALTQFLDSKVGEDADALERLTARGKQVLEGVGIGFAIPTLIAGIRWAKNSGAPWIKEFLQDSDPNLVPKTLKKFGIDMPQKEMVTQHGSTVKYDVIDPAEQKAGLLGKGHYVTTDEKQARYYAGTGKPSYKSDIDVKFDQAMKDNDDLSMQIWDRAKQDATPTELRKEFTGSEAEKIIDEYENMLPGYIYRQEIPDDIIEKSLHYKTDKQSDFVMNAIEDIKKEIGVSYDSTSGQSIYFAIQQKLGSEEAAQQMLRKHGIKGNYQLNVDGDLKSDIIMMYDPKDVQLLSRDGVGITQTRGGLNIEAIPGKDYLNIQNVPIAQKKEFTDAMQKIFINDKGEDVLANALGIKVKQVKTGSGEWEGVINPNWHPMWEVPEGGLTKEFIDKLNAYADITGSVLKQDGVGWRLNYAPKQVASLGGKPVNIIDAAFFPDVNLTSNQVSKLQKELGDYGLEAIDGGGFHIVDYSISLDEIQALQKGPFNQQSIARLDELINQVDTASRKFRKKIKEVLESNNIDVSSRIGYNKQSNLRMVGDHYNWENQDDILSRIEKTTRSDRRLADTSTRGASDLRGVTSELETAAEGVRKKYTEKFGWGKGKGNNAAIAAPVGAMGAQQSEADAVVELKSSEENIKPAVVGQKPNANTVIAIANAKNPADVAYKYLGLSENTDEGAAAVKGFFDNILGKWNPDNQSDKEFAASKAWCAAFLTQVLRDSGVDTEKMIGKKDKFNQIRAASYLKVGTPVQSSQVKPGDIMIKMHSAEDRKKLRLGVAHTGIVAKVEGDEVYFIGGNTGDRVELSSYNTIEEDVRFRRIRGVSDIPTESLPSLLQMQVGKYSRKIKDEFMSLYDSAFE